MDIDADYERLTVPCHSCGHTNVLSRANDVGHTRFAIGEENTCESCGGPIRVTLETASPDYQLLQSEARGLRAEKRYMLAVAALAQSFEMFFALAIRVMLVRHVANFGGADQNEVENLDDMLYKTTQRFTYTKMRNMFINLALRPRPLSITEAAAFVHNAENLAKEPTDNAIRSAHDTELGEILLRLKRLQIGSLRNRVVHKHAYRPRLEELNESLDPARQLTDQLWIRLDLTRSLIGD